MANVNSEDLMMSGKKLDIRGKSHRIAAKTFWRLTFLGPAFGFVRHGGPTGQVYPNLRARTAFRNVLNKVAESTEIPRKNTQKKSLE
ncbi:MAG: hypothetical protein AAFU71_13535 [Cyanobacteria bacterium J06632_22]